MQVSVGEQRHVYVRPCDGCHDIICVDPKQPTAICLYVEGIIAASFKIY